jgi:hypothetical protein
VALGRAGRTIGGMDKRSLSERYIRAKSITPSLRGLLYPLPSDGSTRTERYGSIEE